MKTIKRYFDYLIEGGAVLAFIGIWLSIVIQVFARYLFKFPTPWAEELSRFLNVWAVFLAAAWAAKKGTHIAIRAVVNRLSASWQRYVLLCIDILVTLLLLAVFWGSVSMMQSSSTMFSTALHLRMTYFYLGLAIGSFAMVCSYIGWIIKILKKKS